MGDVSLEMIWRRLDDMAAEQKATRAEMQQGLATLTQTVDAQSTTLVSMRREIRTLQGDVAIALSALDDHSRRLGVIEKSDEDQPHA